MWTAPKTWVTGEVLTAADLNLHLRDNLIALRDEAPRARVYHSGAQSILSNIATILLYNSERYDTDAIHDNVGNNSRLTCRTAGAYLFVATQQFATNGTGRREFALRHSGVTFVGVDERIAVPGAPTAAVVAAFLALAVNDYVEVRVFQDSGAALDIEAVPATSAEFSMVRIA